MTEPIYGKNNKEELPLEHYLALFKEADPREISLRCRLPYDETTGTFAMELMGEAFTVSHPDFTIVGVRPLANNERILFLRYLLDGKYVPAGGSYQTYREMPWGEVYLQQFTGRCIKRFAFSYGFKPDLLRKVAEKLPTTPLSRGDVGFELTLMPGLTLQFMLWVGDDEFPPNGQILFSDNFRYAFTAEDMAVVGDIVLNRMKQLGAAL